VTSLQALLVHDLDDRPDALVELRRWQARQRTVSEEQRLVIVPRDLGCLSDSERADSYGDGDGRRARGGHDCAQEMKKAGQSHCAASFESVGNSRERGFGVAGWSAQ